MAATLPIPLVPALGTSATRSLPNDSSCPSCALETGWATARPMSAGCLGRPVERDPGDGRRAPPDGRSRDPATGLIRTIQSGVGDSAAVQDLGYVFDSLGNLTTREDFIQDVYESFAYDRLNRLTGATVHDAEDDTGRAAKTYRYDAIGNIVNKSDLGAADYVYGSGNAAGAGDAGPHAVVSAGGHSYAYDDNGNMVSGAGRTLTWTSFNKPATVVDPTTTTRFAHGPDRARIRPDPDAGGDDHHHRIRRRAVRAGRARPARRQSPSTTYSPARSASPSAPRTTRRRRPTSSAICTRTISARSTPSPTRPAGRSSASPTAPSASAASPPAPTPGPTRRWRSRRSTRRAASPASR